MYNLAKLLSLWSLLAVVTTASPGLREVDVHSETPESGNRRLHYGYWWGYDTIEDFVYKNTRLTSLYASLEAGGLAPGGPLETDGLLTLFAPTNFAFTGTFETYPGLEDFLSDPANAEVLANITLYHVVGGEILPRDIPPEGITVTTALGEDLTAFKECYMWGWYCYVGLIDGSPDVTWVTGFNRFATNGVTHLIDKVLIPPSLYPAVEPFLPTV